MDPSKVPSVTLNNGEKMPIIGLGTWQSPPDGSLHRSVKTAIECGYRHIDCAYAYENEEEVGTAIAECIKMGTVKRDDLFIVTKLWLTFLKRERVPLCVKRSLSKLGLKQLDLVLMHWPMAFKQVDDALVPLQENGDVAMDLTADYVDAWKGLEDCVHLGLVKSIGISNFNSIQIDRLLKSATIKPVTNQIECHPYLAQKKMIKFCSDRSITITAYSPLGNPGSAANHAPDKGQLLKDPVVSKMAEKYGKNIGQILIKFQVQRGVICIPKSVSKQRIESNIQIFDFDLSPEDIASLEALDRNYRSCLFDVHNIPKHPIYPFKDNIEF